MGLRSVRFGSELGRCVLVVRMFRTREPSRSHPAPCGLFVPARAARHAFAFGGMAPKFVRWIHGAPYRKKAGHLEIKSQAVWRFPNL
jgi:hypothetical protein